MLGGSSGDHEDESWRDRLADRLALALTVAAAVACAIVWTMIRGEVVRLAGTGFGIGVTLLLGSIIRTRWIRGRKLAQLLVATGFATTLVFYALIGFMPGPATMLAITLMLAGLLLGRRDMFVLAGLYAIAIPIIGWAMVSGALPAPDATDVSVLSARAWARTTATSLVLMGLFTCLVIEVVAQIERSLERAQSETHRREILERERATAQVSAMAAQQLETVGRMAAGVAHDFNNNLTVVIGAAEVLKRRLGSAPDDASLVGEILEASQRASDLTRQLLAYSRRAPMATAPTDLHLLLRGALTLLRRSIDPGVEVVERLAGEGFVVEGDATLLQNALLNLLLNARDAMPEGGTLDVATRAVQIETRADDPAAPLATGRYCVIEIADTGPGIDPAVLPRIFEPFFTTKPAGKGTGLGLSAVLGTVNAHGGRVDVESRGGRGTLFRVLLPVVEREAISRRGEDTLVRGTGEVLVVDDEQAVRSTAVTALRSLGYAVTAAEGGPEAIEMVSASAARFDLVLLDLRMPKLSGRQTFERLRRIAPALKILICSGFGAEADLEAMFEAGAAGFVQKPYGAAALSRSVAEAIAAAPRSASPAREAKSAELGPSCAARGDGEPR